MMLLIMNRKQGMRNSCMSWRNDASFIAQLALPHANPVVKPAIKDTYGFPVKSCSTHG